MRVLFIAVALLAACTPIAQPSSSVEPTVEPTAPTTAPATPRAEPEATPTPSTTSEPYGPQFAPPAVTIAPSDFPVAFTLALTRAAIGPEDEGNARWGVERYLEALDRYREEGGYLPASGPFGRAVAAALLESRTAGVKRKFVLESLKIQAVYHKPWGTQALADVSVTIADRALDGSAPDQIETGLLRLSGDRGLRVIDAWDHSADRWFNGHLPSDPAEQRSAVAQAIASYLHAESWIVPGMPLVTYFSAERPTPFQSARTASLATFDRKAIASRVFEDVVGTVEREETFAEAPLGGIVTVRIAATVVTTSAAGRTQRELVTRRVKVFFGNWMPEVVDEEMTPGAWRALGDLALVEIDINRA